MVSTNACSVSGRTAWSEDPSNVDQPATCKVVLSLLLIENMTSNSGASIIAVSSSEIGAKVNLRGIYSMHSTKVSSMIFMASSTLLCPSLNSIPASSLPASCPFR